MSVVQTQCKVDRAGQAGGLERTVIGLEVKGGMEVGSLGREEEKKNGPGGKAGSSVCVACGSGHYSIL